MFAAQAGNSTASARAPEGRFHYDGQSAIYTSLTQEGAGVAIQRYLKDDDEPRVIVPLEVSVMRILDLRHHHLGGDTIPPTSVVWQDERVLGHRASTWVISDDARQKGAQGMLYRARTRPDLSHLVLFGVPVPGDLTQALPAKQWP